MNKRIVFIFLLFIFPVLAQAQHFTFTANTGDSYSIVVNAATLNGNPLQNGDEIGVFTLAGLCVGATVWNGTTPLALTAWADDPQTPAADGFVAGEVMSFKIWASGDDVEYPAEANFSTGNGAFGYGAYCMVSLSVTSHAGNAIVVTNTNDSAEGSLRWAIEQANSTPGPDSIVFNIPESDARFDTSTGVWMIFPESALPVISDSNLVIDGFSQSKFIGEDVNPEGPEIELDGGKLSNANESGVAIHAPGVHILGLIIGHFPASGVQISNIETGRISGCYIGVSSDGLEPAPNGGNGVFLNWTRHFEMTAYDTIPNIISGNGSHGIYLVGGSHNLIAGNLIGVNRTKTDTLGNGFEGIMMVDADSNAVTSNVIGGNYSSNGINIIRGGGNVISQNAIGCDAIDPDRNLGNSGHGICISQSSGNRIVENTIAHNHVYGINVYGDQALHNKMVRNSIFLNLWAGIKNESGGNKELEPPILTAATSNSVAGTALPNATIEIFTDEQSQGAIYLGTVAADTAGQFSWTGEGLLPGFFYTATATDANGNTSEFSNALQWVSDVKEAQSENAPGTFCLFQNYPNPFNPSTSIRFELPTEARAMIWVRLRIYNVRGERIRTLLNEEKTPGVYRVTWDGRNETGHDVAAGTYFCRITAGRFQATQKMLLLK